MIKNEKLLLSIGIIGAFFILIIVTILFLSSQMSGIIYKSILIGALFSILNFGIGYLLISYSIKRSDKIFLMALWGGLLFRLILMLSLVISALIFLEINAYGFIFSILFFYIFYLIIEIFYLDLRRKSQFDGK